MNKKRPRGGGEAFDLAGAIGMVRIRNISVLWSGRDQIVGLHENVGEEEIYSVGM